MERDTTAKKIIFFVLDMLLLMGAITVVLTINGGRWLISNPAFYQPEELGANPMIPNTGATPESDAGHKEPPQPAGACPAPIQLAGYDSVDTLLLLKAYNAMQDVSGEIILFCGS